MVMGEQILGIDISDGHVAGVVLEQQRRSTQLLRWHSLDVPDEGDLAAVIQQLCEQLLWQGGPSLCGLPLSKISIRNLVLPFGDVKKIAQALPFELEEQLLAPLDTAVYDYSLCRRTGDERLLVVFTADAQWLGQLLADTNEHLDPDRVLPAMVALAEQIVKHQDDSKAPFLLVHADLHSMNIALVLQGTPVFFRRLSHPEAMIMHPPFVVEHGLVRAEYPAAEECVSQLAALIEQSLDFFQIDNRVEGKPERIVLAGPLSSMDDGLVEMLSTALRLPVERLDLLGLSGMSCTEEQREQWHGPELDRALALALAAGKRGGINLRQGHLAKKVSLLASRKRLITVAAAVCALLLAGLAYLGVDTYSLQQRDKALLQEMTSIYKATFPTVTKVHDPYVEMQAKLKALQGAETPTPFFVADKWVIPLLADISRRMPASLAFKVGRLSIDRDGVAMKGTTDTYNGVEMIKAALAASPQFKSVRIVTATADKGKKDGAIRFEVQMQLEGL